MANILFVNKLSPKTQGGAETRIREVTRRLVQRGHRVSVICGRTALDEPASEDDDGVHIRYLKPLPGFILRRMRPGHFHRCDGIDRLLRRDGAVGDRMATAARRMPGVKVLMKSVAGPIRPRRKLQPGASFAPSEEHVPNA